MTMPSGAQARPAANNALKNCAFDLLDLGEKH
jgi:hypothetical protein